MFNVWSRLVPGVPAEVRVFGNFPLRHGSFFIFTLGFDPVLFKKECCPYLGFSRDFINIGEDLLHVGQFLVVETFFDLDFHKSSPLDVVGIRFFLKTHARSLDDDEQEQHKTAVTI